MDGWTGPDQKLLHRSELVVQDFRPELFVTVHCSKLIGPVDNRWSEFLTRNYWFVNSGPVRIFPRSDFFGPDRLRTNLFCPKIFEIFLRILSNLQISSLSNLRELKGSLRKFKDTTQIQMVQNTNNKRVFLFISNHKYSLKVYLH